MSYVTFIGVRMTGFVLDDGSGDVLAFRVKGYCFPSSNEMWTDGDRIHRGRSTERRVILSPVFPPDGYRIMRRGEKKRPGDLVMDFASDDWGSVQIDPSAPQHENLLYARKICNGIRACWLDGRGVLNRDDGSVECGKCNATMGTVNLLVDED